MCVLEMSCINFPQSKSIFETPLKEGMSREVKLDIRLPRMSSESIDWISLSSEGMLVKWLKERFTVAYEVFFGISGRTLKFR